MRCRSVLQHTAVSNAETDTVMYKAGRLYSTGQNSHEDWRAVTQQQNLFVLGGEPPA